MSIAILCAGISFGLEKSRINPLSDHQEISKFNQENHLGGILKEGVENYKRLDSVVTYNYSDVDSTRSYKYDYDYDEAENQVIEAFYVWDSELKQWKGSNIPIEGYGNHEYGYDEAGGLTSWSKFQWVPELNDLNETKEENIYDDARNLVLRLLYKWDAELNDWVKYRRYEYSYDEAGNRILDTRYDWDSELNNWVEYRKYEYSYDEVGNKTLYARYGWDSDLDDWLLNQKSFYYYSELYEVFDQLPDIEIILYPNPTSGIINIVGLTELAEVKLYSIQGQLMKSIMQVAYTIDISDLIPGIYILNLQAQDQILVWKVMKE